MSIVRLLGLQNLACGCVVGHYLELATRREVSYVEEKGDQCREHGHRRNHTVTAPPCATGFGAPTIHAV